MRNSTLFLYTKYLLPTGNKQGTAVPGLAGEKGQR